MQIMATRTSPTAPCILILEVCAQHHYLLIEECLLIQERQTEAKISKSLLQPVQIHYRTRNLSLTPTTELVNGSWTLQSTKIGIAQSQPPCTSLAIRAWGRPFSQISSSTNLRNQKTPRRGLFISSANIRTRITPLLSQFCEV